ncbi:hypothetical protein [Clostridium sp. FP1]|uniref:hypothetical protein n=1 Tax=Clostridium sp. FP1 TaxID=2724076 RepID=UPI0013E999CB|nr:hypothetical protein [Clostridium sp. FP1]MBZ9637497.1 hypothetical protein [Clostridium sp. FP1]
MLQTLEVHKLLSGNIFKTNLFFGNSMVFIERPDFFTNPNQQSGYISIQRFNYITQDFYRFQFSKPVDLITYTSCHSVIYYAYINNEKGNYYINLNKVNCINWNDENILTIDMEVSEDNVIQTCDMNSCLSVIGTDNDKIIYLTTFQKEVPHFYKWGAHTTTKRKLQWESKSPSEVVNYSSAGDDLTQCFKENTTEVIFFNFKLNQTKIIKIKEMFNHIAYFNEKLYGVLNKEKCIEIYDINKKQKIFTTNTDEGIIYIDDENIVTCKYISGEFKNLFTVNNLIIGNITTFKSRFSEFVCDKNMLVLF